MQLRGAEVHAATLPPRRAPRRYPGGVACSARCSSAWSTSARGATRPCSPRWPPPPGRPARRPHRPPPPPRRPDPGRRGRPPRLAAAAVATLDLRGHDGVHPRIGVVDVVPFVALDGATPADALAARDRFGAWAADELGVPGFAYGPERTAARGPPPGLRRRWPRRAARPARTRPPGPCAVGARPVLVAYNVWLRRPDLALARRVAARGPRRRRCGRWAWPSATRCRCR